MNLLAHGRRIKRAHQTSNRQLNQRKNLAIGNHHLATTAFNQRVCGKRHVIVVGA